MLMNWLESIDQKIVLFINGLNTPFLDELMWFISGKLSLLPLYLILLYFLKKHNGWQQTFIILIGLILTISIADQTSVIFFKNTFARYRPSHNEELKNFLHFYQISPGEYYKGGKYGFVSSHAANFFAMIVFLYPFFEEHKDKILAILILFGILIGFSRIYLGVHYFSDVAIGAFVGSLVGYLVRKGTKFTLNKVDEILKKTDY